MSGPPAPRIDNPRPPAEDRPAAFGSAATHQATPPMDEIPPVAPSRPWLPYVAPMAAFLLLTSAEGYLPKTTVGTADPTWYAVAYAAKVAIVSVVAWLCRSAWRDLTPRPNLATLALAVWAGLAVAAVWVIIDPYTPRLPFSGGARVGFDPHSLAVPGRYAFLAARLYGLVVLVPLVEELFWRSFLMRWVIDPDFLKVPVGRVTLAGAAVTSGLFALAHPEWLAALLTGLNWALLLRQTRSLSACVVSHAVANAALGAYVLTSGDWKFW